jgi:hypothetical protein
MQAFSSGRDNISRLDEDHARGRTCRDEIYIYTLGIVSTNKYFSPFRGAINVSWLSNSWKQIGYEKNPSDY